MRVLVVGASTVAQMISDILEELHSELTIQYIDDNKDLWGTEVLGREVLSVGTEEIKSVCKDYDAAFVGVGFHKLMKFRQRVFEDLNGRIELLNVVHPTAHVSKTVDIGCGNYIGAFSYVAPQTSLGHCNFFSAGTIIEHHNKIGHLNSWGPSNSTSGLCVIGDRTCFGTNVRLIYSVNVSDDVIISSNSLVCRDVPEHRIVRALGMPNTSVNERRDRWMK